MVKVHEVIKEYVDKIVEVRTREEIIKEVPVEVEKIVKVNSKDCDIKEVQVVKEKVVEVPKVVELVNTKNVVQNQLQVVDRFEQTSVPVYTTVEKIVEVPQILEKIVERIVVMPQVVEVLKYVHEVCETESLGCAVTGNVQVQEAKFRELYVGSKEKLEVLLVELRKLRTRNPEFKAMIDIIEKYLIDFDRLASVQRIIGVPTEKIVEKEVDRAVLVPTKDSEIIKNELAMSILIEKLILQIKEIKKSNPQVKLNLDDDVLLVFFTELYDQQNVAVSSGFTENLKQYTQSAISKFTQMGGNWTNDHELMLNTILEERFAMANLVKQANLEIEKVKSISDKRAATLREKETQFLQISKQLSEFYKVVNTLYETSEGRRVFSGSSAFSKLFTDLGDWMKSEFVVKLDEPVKVIGDFVGSGNEWNRIQSLLREREREIEVLKIKILDIEKTEFKKNSTSTGQELTIAMLRQENDRLNRELSKSVSSSSLSSNGQQETLIAFLKQ